MDGIRFLCVAVSIIFWIMAVLFAVLKEKGAILIAGFNTMPKEQRERYDKAQMSKDMRNVVFFREVYLDEKKAFERYRLK